MKSFVKIVFTIVFFQVFLTETVGSQTVSVLEKTRRKQIPDVEQPNLHTAPFIYYKHTLIYLNREDTISGWTYWRRNFTDQFLETWTTSRMYPASRIFGFIQDSIYFRSTMLDDYHIFVPQIYRGNFNLYYTRPIHNLGQIRMISKDTIDHDYQNQMIITGDLPRRYANDYTYYVTFPWDTLKMVPVTRQSLSGFAKTYLRAYPDAYKEAMLYERPEIQNILAYTLLPLAVASTAAFLIVEGKPVYFIGIGAGALLTYLSVKLFVKPRMLDPEGMIGIMERCR
ncbi:MAG: hypothetical protein WCL00_13205 [Bacteroidota bacterium]